jgi:phosphoglycolate phosphatase
MFDFDGTLADSVEAIVHAMQVAFAELGFPEPAAHLVRTVVGLSLAPAIKRLLEREIPEDDLTRLIATYKAEHLRFRSREGYEEPLYDGIRTVLEGLGRRGVRCGVATGKSRQGLLHSLDRHALGPSFSVLKTADDGPGKPDPFMLRTVCEETGCAPDETAMVGDTVYDVTMAIAAGVLPIGVTWGYHPRGALAEAGATHLVDSSAELGRLLERLI